MVRTTINITEELLEFLIKQRADTGVSASHYIRILINKDRRLRGLEVGGVS